MLSQLFANNPHLIWMLIGLGVLSALVDLTRRKRRRRRNSREKLRREPGAGRFPKTDYPNRMPDPFPDPIANEPRPAVYVDTTRWNIELLRALEWKRFEVVCASYFMALGFRIDVAREGADGGIDIKLFQSDAAKPDIIVQCKAWNTYDVGVKPVRELFGVMAHEGVSEGIFLTTSAYTEEARRFAVGKNLHLIDGADFIRKIEALAPHEQHRLLEVATRGDYTTPTCPSCGTKMVLRQSRKDGSSFWGCTGYPKCRQMFRIGKQGAVAANGFS